MRTPPRALGTPPALLLGLLGRGIALSRTPALHEHEARHHGLACLYLLLDADVLGYGEDDLGEWLRWLPRCGYRGANVTHPFKRAAVRHLHALHPDARILGSVNTVVFGPDGRAVGHNTDAPAFAAVVERELADEPRGRVLLLGAGGAGVAVARALLLCGTRELFVHDLEPARIADLAARLAPHHPEARIRAAGDPRELRGRLDGLVNATPVGMAGHPGLPVDPALLDGLRWVADIVYFPRETALLSEARRRGCRTLDGSGMAVMQAALAFRLWTGREPDVARMRLRFEELEAEVAGRLSGTDEAPIRGGKMACS